jgi:hypothetical protein
MIRSSDFELVTRWAELRQYDGEVLLDRTVVAGRGSMWPTIGSFLLSITSESPLGNGSDHDSLLHRRTINIVSGQDRSFNTHTPTSRWRLSPIHF